MQGGDSDCGPDGRGSNPRQSPPRSPSSRAYAALGAWVARPRPSRLCERFPYYEIEIEIKTGLCAQPPSRRQRHNGCRDPASPVTSGERWPNRREPSCSRRPVDANGVRSRRWRHRYGGAAWVVLAWLGIGRAIALVLMAARAQTAEASAANDLQNAEGITSEPARTSSAMCASQNCDKRAGEAQEYLNQDQSWMYRSRQERSGPRHVAGAPTTCLVLGRPGPQAISGRSAADNHGQHLPRSAAIQPYPRRPGIGLPALLRQRLKLDPISVWTWTTACSRLPFAWRRTSHEAANLPPRRVFLRPV